MRYVYEPGKDLKVLELGCGAGANIPFFKSLGIDYYAIEGSECIVKNLHSLYPDLKQKIITGDFTKKIEFDTKFDLVIDRASLTHNASYSIKSCLDLLSSKMDGNAKFIGIDWFSTEHSEYKKGISTVDKYTRCGYDDGYFSHLGNVHFSDQIHLNELFCNFKIKILEHKVVKRKIPNEVILASWNFVAEKV